MTNNEKAAEIGEFVKAGIEELLAPVPYVAGVGMLPALTETDVYDATRKAAHEAGLVLDCEFHGGADGPFFCLNCGGGGDVPIGGTSLEPVLGPCPDCKPAGFNFPNTGWSSED